MRNLSKYGSKNKSSWKLNLSKNKNVGEVSKNRRFEGNLSVKKENKS